MLVMKIMSIFVSILINHFNTAIIMDVPNSSILRKEYKFCLEIFENNGVFYLTSPSTISKGKYTILETYNTFDEAYEAFKKEIEDSKSE